MSPEQGSAPRLVLASASPARLRLLRAAGLHPEVMVSGVDETVEGALATREVVQLLAERKATAVAERLESGLVIGADSLLDLGGEVFGKPWSAEVARERWRRLRGERATLCTGQCLIDAATGRAVSTVIETAVLFASPTDAELEAYIESGEPLEVAGGFTIDGLGSFFVERIEGDASAVIGLSVAALRRQLGELGVGLPGLWGR